MSSYRELDVWKKSFRVTALIYEATKSFPKEEMYGLTSQIRRAAISLPSNIAEGSKRGTNKDFCQFLRIAQGSGAELETQLLLAQQLGYLSESNLAPIFSLVDDVMRMLTMFIKKLSMSDDQRVTTNE